jgi:predicted dehydrogenase
MIKAAIIGCGKVSDKHALQIARIPNAKLVAVCDVEPLMTQQMAERFGVERQFTDALQMIDEVDPDVVHITTPPQTHFDLGRMCLLAGAHVYIEKPFTVNAAEAEELVALAIRKDLKLTVGHNAQFTPVMTRMRELVNAGYLGGKPVHMESIFCYETGGDAGYAKAFLGDAGHWLRSLPGSLLQNIISHGIGKIAEFLTGERPVVIAHGFTSPSLKKLGQEDIIDELRVIIRDEDDTTAYFTFSTQIQPSLHQFRISGPKRSLIADDDNQVLTKLNAKEYKSYVPYFVGPAQIGRQYFGSLVRNVREFLKGDFHLPPDTGLMRLMNQFYAAIGSGSPLPLSYREILLTSRIMDEVFSQVLTDRRKRIARMSSEAESVGVPAGRES